MSSIYAQVLKGRWLVSYLSTPSQHSKVDGHDLILKSFKWKPMQFICKQKILPLSLLFCHMSILCNQRQGCLQLAPIHVPVTPSFPSNFNCEIVGGYVKKQLLVHHYSHYYNWQCQQIMSDMASVTNPSKSHSFNRVQFIQKQVLQNAQARKWHKL